MSRGGAVEISFDVDDDDTNATSELEEYLLEQQKRPNGVSGFFSNVGSGIQRILPRKIGGTTGSIQDDIALRFGSLFGSTTSLDSSAPSQPPPTSSGWFTLVCYDSHNSHKLNETKF